MIDERYRREQYYNGLILRSGNLKEKVSDRTGLESEIKSLKKKEKRLLGVISNYEKDVEVFKFMI